jgi:regulatory protein
MAGRITAIQVQKKNPQRANVFIEGDFAFGLALIEAAKLKPGTYLDDADIQRLLQSDEQERAYEQTLHFLSYRPRSRSEVSRYLRDKDLSEQATEAAMERLERAGLLDDEAFARYWISNREQFRPRGERALRYELRQKGVDDRVIDDLLQDTDEMESAYRAAVQRIERWKRLDPAERRQKLSGYLQRRGFGYEAIRDVWERLEKEFENET